MDIDTLTLPREDGYTKKPQTTTYSHKHYMGCNKYTKRNLSPQQYKYTKNN